tara:strand:- start:2965 stop:4011 length:1047 start_codon:yes stop_codon:yes gene_type:complete
MISLKRNNKGELVPATGLRTRASSIYIPNQTDPFKISRSKFSDFLTCQRCFYLDRVKGLASPSMPGWTLNETTDLLLKKEFDACRANQTPHRIFSRFGLDHVVPFQHEDMDKWRNSLQHGLQIQFKDTNIILQGGVDDIWLDKNTSKLIVVDYKSQANSRQVNTEDYLSNVFHQGYKVQMDFYAYLLTEMGFEVFPTSYFYVCNADRSADSFDSKMKFYETLVPYELDTGWIEEKVIEMISLLNSEELPEINDSCENCAYAHQRSNKENGVQEIVTENFKQHQGKRKCPKCGSDQVTLITYGYPDGSPEVMEKIKNEEVELGGCCVDDNSPKWKCQDCEERFGKINWA